MPHETFGAVPPKRVAGGFVSPAGFSSSEEQEPPTLRRMYRAKAPPLGTSPGVRPAAPSDAPLTLPVEPSAQMTSSAKRATMLSLVILAALVITLGVGVARWQEVKRNAAARRPTATSAPLGDRPSSSDQRAATVTESSDTTLHSRPSVEGGARAATGIPAENLPPAPAVEPRRPPAFVARPTARERMPPTPTPTPCTPPYTTDAEGIRHPKLECL
jgi:hypothetical protein